MRKARESSVKALPNLLTLSRIALGAVVFLLLAAGAGALPGQSGPPSGGATLIWTSEVLFVLAAVTDYFDGWLARTLNAASPWGAILDPIADKIAVAAAILGLTVLAPLGAVPLPGFLILFREVLVSGLREGVGPRGIKIPVTGLAKWKTTVQLVALALEIAATQASFGSPLRLGADVMLWAAAILTLWTGAGYIRAARLALK
jgi:CDP-diacylglycerol--glycerol-3-phosphate 3-phosphatidyltransferase